MKIKKALTSVSLLLSFCAAAIFSQDADGVIVPAGNAVNAIGELPDGFADAVNDIHNPAVAAPEAPLPPESSDRPAEDGKEKSRPKIAVYVTGGASSADNKALSTYILSALIRVKSNQYEAIERSDAFLTQIDAEHVAQRSGAVDDAQISRLGKQSGVQFVCVADITPVRGAYQISARILDVETAKVVTVGVANSPLKSADDLKKAATTVVEAMFNLLSPDSTSRMKIRFGARIAYNNAYLRSVSVSETFSDDRTGLVVNTYENKLGYGSGFGAGGVVSFDFPGGSLSVVTGLDFVYRRPVNLDILKISEAAIAVPALVRWRVFKDQGFYLEGGAQAELPLMPMIAHEGEEPEKFEDRKKYDAAFVIGAGYRIDKNFFLDIRGVIGMIQFDSYKNHLMNQACIGVGYMF